ncbi:hypothetical protein [Trueperella abortisuis]|uniref:hypothetical protein n=1 Tax=Trueperella abortisuis TaxID=445930 RepID=UPI00289378B7|nr:hypothetical protein [Trueperella abortisuis]
MIRLRYPLRAYLVSFFAAAAAYLLIAFAMRDRIFEAYNTVTLLPWIYVTFLGGITAAASAFLTRSHAEADENAISLTSPRSRIALNAADFIVQYATLAVMPFALSFTATLLASMLVSNRGYLDPSYIPSALALLGALVLIGQTLGLLIPHRILCVLAAFIAGQFLGLYTNTTRIINNWDSANPQVWAFIVPILLLALAARSSFESFSAHRIWMSRAAVATCLVAFFVAFYFLSPIKLTTERQDSDSAHTCTPVGEDLLCTWNESDYRVPFLSAEIARAQLLRKAANIDLAPILYYEPGLNTDRLTTAPPDRRIALPSLGGTAKSVMSTQAITGDILADIGHPLSVCGTADITFDLATNFIYGNISTTDYRSTDAEHDSEVRHIAQEWVGLTDEQIAQKLVTRMRNDLQLCDAPEDNNGY